MRRLSFLLAILVPASAPVIERPATAVPMDTITLCAWCQERQDPVFCELCLWSLSTELLELVAQEQLAQEQLAELEHSGPR